MLMGKIRMHRKVLCDWKSVKMSQVIRALIFISTHDPMQDYGYTGNWQEHLDYCCDRMNGGRARDILRLIKRSYK